MACFCRFINGYLVWRLISQLAAPILSQPFSDAYQAYRQVVEGMYKICPPWQGVSAINFMDHPHRQLRPATFLSTATICCWGTVTF